MKTSFFASLAALALAVLASAAAPVTYSYYTATGQADTNWVSVPGYDSIVAGNVGGIATTSFGSVNWLPMTTGNVQTSASGVSVKYDADTGQWATVVRNTFYAGGPSLLNDGAWSSALQNNNVDYTIDLSGLIEGKDYKIQFVLADKRADSGHATILAKGGNVTGDSTRYRYSYMDGQFAVITASFTADATTAQFQPGQRWADDVPDQTFVSGIQVLADAGSNPLLNWINATWPTLPNKETLGDSDNDGISNLMEYVLQDGDPSVSSTAILPTSITTETDFIFTFFRRAAATGTTQIFQYASNLSTWIDVPVTDGGVVAITPNTPVPGIEQVVITIAKGSNTALFGRLKVMK